MIEATGGVVTERVIDGKTYRIHTFTAGGTFSVITGGLIEHLIIGGGGSGGKSTYNTYGTGGGGAGGLITNIGTGATRNPGSYPVIVGAGGAAVKTGSTILGGNKGSNSSVFGLTAFGGGAPVAYTAASSGGSGGGGDSSTTNAGGSGTAGQGNAGGTSRPYASQTNTGAGGGGGGASQAGANGALNLGGKGGDGTLLNMDGTARYFAGGGGGTAGSSYTVGDGGLGGGTAGAKGVSSLDATNGTGGGSGGCVLANNIANTGSGKGGDGIVILRYEIPSGVSLVPQSINLTSPFVGSPQFTQNHNMIGTALLSQSPTLTQPIITQVHGLSADGISVVPILPLVQITPDPMPTEVRVTLYDPNGDPYPNGTPVFIYKADGTLEYSTAVGQIVGNKPGVYPLADVGQLAVRFPAGDFQQRFMVVGPAVDEAGLVTNLLTAIQLIAGQG